jgi:hypothetical protein
MIFSQYSRRFVSRALTRLMIRTISTRKGETGSSSGIRRLSQPVGIELRINLGVPARRICAMDFARKASVLRRATDRLCRCTLGNHGRKCEGCSFQTRPCMNTLIHNGVYRSRSGLHESIFGKDWRRGRDSLTALSTVSDSSLCLCGCRAHS